MKTNIHFPWSIVVLFLTSIITCHLFGGTITLEEAVKRANRINSDKEFIQNIHDILIKYTTLNANLDLVIEENRALELIENETIEYAKQMSSVPKKQYNPSKQELEYLALELMLNDEEQEQKRKEKDDEQLAFALQQEEYEDKQAPTLSISKTIPKSAPAITIASINANPQSGPTCGYHATFNAKAIQDLFNAHKEINESTIKQQAQQYFKYLGSNDLEISEIIELARIIKLDNIYFLTYENDNIKPAGTFKEVSNFYYCFNSMKNKPSAITHFICNTGAHWVLISAIKKGTSIQLIYLDSANTSLASNALAQNIMQYIASRFTAN